jgi:hypothetical protein
MLARDIESTKRPGAGPASARTGMNEEHHGGLALLEVAGLLDGPEAIAVYLDAVAELDDPAAFVAAVGHAARAYGITTISISTPPTEKKTRISH